MATTQDLERWKAIGGTIEVPDANLQGANKRDPHNVFISPSGKRLKTWKQASSFLRERASQSNVPVKLQPDDPKRAADAEPKDEDGNKENKKKSKKSRVETPPPPAAASASPAKATDADAGRSIGSGRRAAQGDKPYREKALSDRGSKADMVVKIEETIVASEAVAIEETGGRGRGLAERRLLDFAVVDSVGQVQPLDRLILMPGELQLRGVVHPAGEGDIVREQGRRPVSFGSIVEWRAQYSRAKAQLLVLTALGQYAVIRPAVAYRKLHAQLDERLQICHQVYVALTPEAGGSLQASLNEVVAKLARAKVGKSYSGAREALFINARFISSQLDAMSVQAAGGKAAAVSGKSTISYSNTPLGAALTAEVAKAPATLSLMTSSIKIVDQQGSAPGACQQAAPADVLVEADEEVARRMQAQLDAEQFAGPRSGSGKSRGGSAGASKAYIRISEAEIADDYPAPLAYDKEEDEMDELELADEDELNLAPEDLPRRLLSDFAIYNSEGMNATLELLPMEAGTSPDIELFVSGNFQEDEGDWAPEASAGQALEAAAAPAAGASGAGGPSSDAEAAVVPGAAPAAGSGMRIFSTQIQEWMVEFSADLIFISIRTDAAWYRLTKYAPWFRTVLKSAQVAVAIIGMISTESRASKLSFNDIIRRLVEQPDGLHLPKKVDAVERFVVVHGQIILNQFAHFPKAAVQRSAFVTVLRQKMEARRHSKLWMGKAPTATKGRNVNPMKDRAANARPRPMNATATTLVKSVWQSYFLAGPRAHVAALAAGEALVAEEVEEDINAEDEHENDAEEGALAAGAAPSATGVAAAARVRGTPVSASKAPTPAQKRATWVGPSIKTDAAGRTLFSLVKLGDLQVGPGAVVSLELDPALVKEHRSTCEAAVAAEAGPAGGSVPELLPALGLVQCLYQGREGDKMAQVRLMLRGPETVLGDAGSDIELFATNDYETRPVSELTATVNAHRMVGPWEAAHSRAAYQANQELRVRNEERRTSGDTAGLEYVYRTLYCPEDGKFVTLEQDLKLNVFHEEADRPVALGISALGGLVKDGTEYKIGDFMFLHSEAWSNSWARPGRAARDPGSGEYVEEAEEEEEAGPSAPAYAAKSGRHKGSNKGLKAFHIGQLLSVTRPSKGQPLSAITVRPFMRPEDCSADLAYSAAWHEVYAPMMGDPAWEGLKDIDVADVVARCTVVLPGGRSPRLSAKPQADGENVFVCTHSFNPATPSKLSPPPIALQVESGSGAAAGTSSQIATADMGKGKAAAASKSKGRTAAARQGAMMESTAAPTSRGKGKGPTAVALMGIDTDEPPGSGSTRQHIEEADEEEEPSAVAMRTMDIFAGCGGLSEGMHQAGVADTCWAVEYEKPAADAFQLNNPHAKVFCNNCNVLLQAAMQKAGLAEECDACDDAVQAARQLSPEDVAALPLPGEVDFIMGGPPCQGYSGMNRFNKGNWSMVQNSMVMAFLSYCDFYRPRYFLLENVRNFVSHNKSFTFRLTLRTLLEMGYQVRFGVLNAGNFGVPQSRKRTIIWAAAPGEALPEWPAPRHVFHSPQLRINLPNGVQYCAVPDLPGAPLRAVTVKDAIGDLPHIENGAARDEQPYTEAATSAFQKFIRGRNTVLLDHICKEMNELNLERCRCIPKGLPGADWRVLQEIVASDPSRETYKGQPLVPWCLPNTADRHNGWRGLFGRLDLSGHFPTSTTDPQPMGKVGQVFHPTQDRIVSVRECARAQGFPDRYRFSGSVHSRHRQVGNAVPPPLAAALGAQLRLKLEQRRSEEVQRALAAQFGGTLVALQRRKP